MGIKEKLQLAIVPVAVLQLLLVAAACIWLFSKVLTEQRLTHLQSVGELQKSRVLQWFDSRDETIAMLAGQLGMMESAVGSHLDANAQQVAAKRTLQNWLDSCGRCRGLAMFADANSALAVVGEMVADFGQHRGHRLLSVRPGEIAYRHETTADGQYHYQASFVLKTEAASEQPMWVMVIDFDVTDLLAIPQDVTGLGATGEAMLFNRDRAGNIRLLAPLRFDPEATRRRINLSDSIQAPVEAALNGEDSKALRLQDYRDEDVLAIAKGLPELGLAIVIKQDREETLRPVSNVVRLVAVVAVLSSLVYLIAVNLIARRLANPLLALRDRARQIGRDHTGAEVDDEEEDEISDLRRVFVGLTKKLVGAKVELEREVAERTEALEDANRELENLAVTDQLTGIYNRRYFDEHLERMWRLMTRERSDIALLMIDIDYFKGYNDSMGHQAGDAVLTEVAKLISKAARRPLDCAARFGGEEFAVILPSTGEKGALVIAERIRAELDDAGIAHPASTAADMVTVSIGVASASPLVGSIPDKLLERADAALYEAKDAGRDRISVAG